jgi:hypothetical protein
VDWKWIEVLHMEPMEAFAADERQRVVRRDAELVRLGRGRRRSRRARYRRLPRR